MAAVPDDGAKHLTESQLSIHFLFIHKRFNLVDYMTKKIKKQMDNLKNEFHNT